jgi:hypothetical protein
MRSDQEAKPVLRGKRPQTNRLSQQMVLLQKSTPTNIMDLHYIHILY